MTAVWCPVCFLDTGPQVLRVVAQLEPICDSLTAIFPSISPPPHCIHVRPCPQRALAQILLLHLLFPTPPCQLSLHFLLKCVFFLKLCCLLSTFPLPLLSGILKRNQGPFFLRVESLGSPSLLNRGEELAL